MSTGPASLHQRTRVTSQAMPRSIMIRTSSTQWKFHKFQMLSFRMSSSTLLPMLFLHRRYDRPLFIGVLQPDTFAHLCNIVTKNASVTSVFSNSCSWAQKRLMCKQVVAGFLPFSVCRRASNGFPSFLFPIRVWPATESANHSQYNYRAADTRVISCCKLSVVHFGSEFAKTAFFWSVQAWHLLSHSSKERFPAVEQWNLSFYRTPPVQCRRMSCSPSKRSFATGWLCEATQERIHHSISKCVEEEAMVDDESKVSAILWLLWERRSRIQGVHKALVKGLFDAEREPTLYFHRTYCHLYRVPQSHLFSLLPKMGFDMVEYKLKVMKRNDRSILQSSGCLRTSAQRALEEGDRVELEHQVRD